MVSGSLRPSLTSPDLAPFFEAVRAKLERQGFERRGRMKLPEVVSTRGRFLLAAIVDGPVQATVDLAVVERKLTELGVGRDLPAALGALGHPVSTERAQLRAVRQRARDARQAVRDEVGSWGQEWAEEWIDGTLRAGVLAGLDTDEALQVVRDTREILRRIEQAGDAADRASRVDLAATVLGSSHALDWGTPHAAAVTRALSACYGGEGRNAAWERAGVNLDRVSAPVLTWGLAPKCHTALAALVGAATELGVPIHLSQMALRSHPIVVEEHTEILVTENPRMVEAACERRTPFAVVALNGNPSAAARLMLDQLLAAGADLRYHGDFDAAGLGICARMHRLGLTPWRMGCDDYLEALADAQAQGAELPVDTHRSPPTPWDPALRQAFDKQRRVVHEERLIASVLSVGAS